LIELEREIQAGEMAERPAGTMATPPGPSAAEWLRQTQEAADQRRGDPRAQAQRPADQRQAPRRPPRPLPPAPGPPPPARAGAPPRRGGGRAPGRRGGAATRPTAMRSLAWRKSSASAAGPRACCEVTGQAPQPLRPGDAELDRPHRDTPERGQLGGRVGPDAVG